MKQAALSIPLQMTPLKDISQFGCEAPDGVSGCDNDELVLAEPSVARENGNRTMAPLPRSDGVLPETTRAASGQGGVQRWQPRGLLLDFGSVISVSVFERHRDSERLLGLASGTLSWLGPIDPTTDLLWQAMQRDDITEREYWAYRATEVGELVGETEWDITTLLHRIRQTDPNAVIRPQMQRLIGLARASGIRVGILSNELELFYGSDMVARMDVLADAMSIVDASNTGILKPDPRAYAQATKGLGLPPQQILFVDDQFRNVAGAVNAGLQTQHFDLRDVPGNLAAIAVRLQLPIEEIQP
jgi:putative hydrolase of the HAD superfamily